MITGKGAAWKRLGAVNNDLSDIVTQQEMLNNAHEKEKQDALEKQKAEEDKKREEVEGIKNKAYADITPGATGFKGFDVAVRRFYTKEAENFANAKVISADTTGKYSAEEKIQAEALITRLMDSIGYIKRLKEGVPKIAQLIKQGEANGTIDPKLNKGWEKILQTAIDSDFSFSLNEAGIPVVGNISGLDLDGDGTPDNNYSIDQLLDINTYVKVVPSYNQEALFKELGTNYKAVQEKYNKDGQIIDTKGFKEEQRGSLNQFLNQRFGKDFNTITDAGRVMLLAKGLNPQNDIEFQKIKNQLGVDFTNTLNTKNNVTTDYQAQRMANRSGGGGRKPTEAQLKANHFKNWYEGIKNGDTTSLNYLKGRVITNENGVEVRVEDIEYINGKLRIKFKDKDEIQEYNPSKKEFLTQIAPYMGYKQGADVLTNMLERGVSTKKYIQNNNVESRFLKQKLDGFFGSKTTMKSHDVIPFLEELGFKGYKNLGGDGSFWSNWSNQIELPNKEKVNVNTKDGFKKLKQYVYDNLSKNKEVEKTDPKPDLPD